MSINSENSEASRWPLPKFRFEVDLGIALKVPFQEVSGMDAENGVIEYRKANSPLFASEKNAGY